MHYAEGSLMPLMLLALVFGRMPDNNVPFLLKPVLAGVAKQAHAQYIGPQIKVHLDFLEGDLKGRRWLLGDALSAADIQMSFVIEAAATRASYSPAYPELQRYLAQIRAEPAYQRAIARGGPFTLG
jgi:glutathione S-transferase